MKAHRSRHHNEGYLLCTDNNHKLEQVDNDVRRKEVGRNPLAESQIQMGIRFRVRESDRESRNCNLPNK